MSDTNSITITDVSAVLIPAYIRTGDRAVLHCTFSAPPSYAPSPVQFDFTTATAFTADTNDVSLYAATLTEPIPGSYVFDIELQVWTPGIIRMPHISAPPFLLELPDIQVLSVLTEDQTADIQPMRRPLVVPGTMYRLYAGITVAVVVFAGIIFLLRWLRKSAPERKRQRCARLRQKKLKRSFLQLRRYAAKREFNGQHFCTEFETDVRVYLADAFHIPAESFTTAELSVFFDDYASRQKTLSVQCGQQPLSLYDAAQCVSSLFWAADRIKFGGEEAVAEKCGAMLDDFEHLIPAMESAAADMEQETAYDI